MIYSSVGELKRILDVDPQDASEDAKLLLILEHASAWIEELLNRPGLTLKARTEFYDGSGTPKLLLRHRPVYAAPVIAVNIDETGWYGTPTGSFGATTAMTYGTDFTLKIDQEDGLTSRSGILVRINNLWPRPQLRQMGTLSPFIGESFGNVKVSYTAGYTADNLPAPIRLACNLLVARLRYVFPLGVEFGGDGYEEKSLSIITSERQKLLALVMPLLLPYRNFRW